ncbi:ATP-binding protein [Variovorax ginsengisoli]|uniref:histidine kinase n=1 Tax=Variovorax ginsengisoli TaxID=363844 RepID=A0ABT8SBA6_9BURK|nr:ATP-binding protein [Variovorax ginsengisoli]MDN8616097.1 ATP-binding protein [Variovorax ginsengisoli]MDO1535267.1 ATP-binding protein [Variovorax ginsengisoli]
MHRPGASWSLRRRVTAIALFVCIATLVAGGAAMHRADQLADRNVLDARLVTLAQTVLAFAAHEIEEEGLERGLVDTGRETEHTLGARYHYQIWSQDGRLLHRSRHAPEPASMRPLGERGFGQAKVGGEDFRTYTEAAPKSGMIIEIAERMRDRESAAGITTGYFLAFLAAPLVLILLSTWWFLNRALRSVDSYATQLRERHTLDLTELDEAHPPAELKPMVDSINGLFGRFRQALSVEREFTAIAAHEMRTPLAGLRAQAQLAITLANSPQELSTSLRGLMAGIDQATYLLDRLLDLARVDSLAVAGGHAPDRVKLEEVYRNVMCELGPVASQRDLLLMARFEVDELLVVELGLHMLLHNLIVNAIRYTPAGGRIEVASALGPQSVLITVDDSGPGIPATRHADAFQRFNRLGRRDTHGVGLGLAIVQAVAQAHNAVVHLLESPLGGLRAEVRFPATAHICRAALRKVEVTGSSRY